MDDRMTIANMAIEAGGKNGIFEPDVTTFAYVDERTKANGTKAKYDPLLCDSDDKQKFVYDKKFDLSKLEPTVACHPNPGQRKLAKELGGIVLDRAYIGSCTGGKTSDFLAFADVIKGHKVKIDTFGVPATPDVVHELQAMKMNGKTVWQMLEEAGVQMTENAGCAACLGGPVDTFGRLNKPMKCISATNRNFPGKNGPQGIASVSRVAVHGRRQRHHRQDHRSAREDCRWIRVARRALNSTNCMREQVPCAG